MSNRGWTWRALAMLGRLALVAIVAVVVAVILVPVEYGFGPIAPNEASATATIRSLNAAEERYASKYGNGFTDTLAKLGPPSAGQPNRNHADLVDSVLAGSQRG